MVKHVILWQLKDEFSIAEKENIKRRIKIELEGLKDKIPGLIDIQVHYEVLKSSNAEIMLDSTFEDIDALKNYSIHPEHVQVANAYVRPYTKTRTCIDYHI